MLRTKKDYIYFILLIVYLIYLEYIICFNIYILFYNLCLKIFQFVYFINLFLSDVGEADPVKLPSYTP